MEMGPERSRPLHNFKMPRLKWGNQRFLRCSNVNPKGGFLSADRRQPSALEADKGLLIGRRMERFKKSSPPLGRKTGGDGGIEAVRARLMFDLQTAADRMKDAILREGLEEEEAPVPASAAAEEADRPWNLRTRRAACKAPNGVNGAVGGGGGSGGNGGGGGGSTGNGGVAKGLKVKPNFSPSRLGGDSTLGDADGSTGEKRERPRFSVSLSRREIEEDFLKMVGQRPPRRPKKRPKIVQKELDNLSPGLWLTEVTADIYKVPDAPETAKR